MMNNQTMNDQAEYYVTDNTPGEVEFINRPIHSVDIEKLKNEMFDEIKQEGFEFAETTYTPGYDDKKRTIYLKIANVMGAIDRIPKSGYNTQHQYAYVTESDVVGAIRPLIAKEKLVILPDIRRYREGELKTKYSQMNMGTIEILWKVRDAESYEEIQFSMIGKGVDNMEKDIFKAITGNKKYALITLFMIDSGDDPERDDSNAPNKPNNGNGTPYDYMDQNQSNNQQNKGQNKRNNNSGGKGQQNNKKATNGNSGTNNNKPKQPTKGDLVTRWTVLAEGDGKTKAQKTKDFNEWYDKKKDDGWDHLVMMQALTKKLHEKNQQEKEGQKEESQEDQQGQQESQDNQQEESKESEQGK